MKASKIFFYDKFVILFLCFIMGVFALNIFRDINKSSYERLVHEVDFYEGE